MFSFIELIGYYFLSFILFKFHYNKKLIIARLEKDIIIKSKTIDILTQQLINKECKIVPDLLTFD